MGYPAGRSDETSTAIDEEVKDIIAAGQREAATILSAQRPVLDAMAAALLESETLDADEIAAVLTRVPKWRRLREGIGAIEPGPDGTASHAVA
jgi:cell division protease FtsH